MVGGGAAPFTIVRLPAKTATTPEDAAALKAGLAGWVYPVAMLVTLALFGFALGLFVSSKRTPSSNSAAWGRGGAGRRNTPQSFRHLRPGARIPPVPSRRVLNG